jgi:hypothetical protein
MSNSIFAAPIFGTFELRPIESKDQKLASVVEKAFKSRIDHKRFSDRIDGELSDELKKIKEEKTAREYLAALKKSKSTKIADLIFNIKIQKQKHDLKKLTFVIENNSGRTIFTRESVYDYEGADDYSDRLTLWLTEFEDLLPSSAKITQTSEGNIGLKLVHGSKRLDYRSRPFYIGKYKYDIDSSQDDYDKMGAVTQMKDGKGEGYVFKEFSHLKLKVGSQVIFLNSAAKMNGKQEELVVSETWFNYLNLPKHSLLNCALLPVIGNLKSRVGLHKKLMKMVTDYKMCKFRNNAQLNTILEKHKHNYEEYLGNETVLKLLSQKLKVGALFRLKVYKVLNGISLKFDVVSENGKNIYFSKYMVIEDYNEKYITELVYGWIINYKKSLPLTGRIIQIRDKNLLIDVPAGLVDGSQQEFKVIRPVSLRYEDVLGNRKVKWNTETVAYGVINKIEKFHSIGNIFKYVDRKSEVREGDWISIEDLDYNIKTDNLLYKKHNIKNDRNIGSAHVTTEVTSVKAGGSSEAIYGFGVGLDFYLPFGLIFTGESVRNISGGDSSISNNNFMFSLGYSFTPRLYDFLSLIDVFVGKKIVNYNISGLGGTGIGDLKYSGFFVSTRVEVPIYEKFSLLGEFSLSPSDSVTNTNTLFGNVASSKSYGFTVTGKYKFENGHSLNADFSHTTYNSTYDGVDGVTVNLGSNLVKLTYAIDF